MSFFFSVLFVFFFTFCSGDPHFFDGSMLFSRFSCYQYVHTVVFNSRIKTDIGVHAPKLIILGGSGQI